MALNSKSPVEDYINRCDAKLRDRLTRLLMSVRKAAPDADEFISYKMPAFRVGRIIFYFAAFKNHIGAFPPVRDHVLLEKSFKKFMGPKGNLQFPHDQPIPYALIERLIKHRVKLERARLRTKKG